ncbi:hypothetical protein [Sphingomonas sp. CLY1604]|uniref:hypothetical protein n=1 Tax=Sphingomonas sp. CLY1604 TaxID=3457786 RepID=UPI003FD79C56
MSQTADPLSPYGCRTLVEHEGMRVGLGSEVEAAYEGFEQRVRDKLERIMFRWCCGHSMTEEMFNGNEGRSPGGTMLKAFKSFKHRMYGFEKRIGGVQTFVIVDHDPAKKRDRADQKILKRARGRVDAFGREN